MDLAVLEDKKVAVVTMYLSNSVVWVSTEDEGNWGTQ